MWLGMAWFLWREIFMWFRAVRWGKARLGRAGLGVARSGRVWFGMVWFFGGSK